jgi:ABC-type branched-subunit amino acid transport system substrate-binding protein
MEKVKSLNFIILATLMLFFLITFVWGIYPVPINAEDKPPIKVGIVYPISGVMGTIAIPSYKAHLLAMSEINAKGGLLGGRKFEWIVRDPMGKPELETRYCREMLISEKVDILHAGYGSALGMAASAVVAESGRGLAFLEGGKTSKLRNEKFHRNVFFLEQEDVPEARGMAKALCEYGPLKDIKEPKVYFLSWDYEYGRSLYHWFAPALKKYKPNVKLMEAWTKVAETDYTPYISLIAGAKPDVVVTTIWGGGIPSFLKQAKAYGLWDITNLFASTEVAGVEYLREVGELFPVGTWVNVMELPGIPGNEGHRKYWEAFRKMHGEDPGAFGVRNYIATYFLAKAIENAKSLDPEKLIPALENTSIDTFLGKVWMRKTNHQMMTGMYWGPLIKSDPPYHRTLDKAKMYWLNDIDVSLTDDEILNIRKSIK